jgi:PAS domain S-box-containing protein
MSDVRILIAESDPTISNELQGILENLCFTVVGVAHLSSEIIPAILASQPNVVLMNLHNRAGGGITPTGGYIHKKFAVPVVYIVDQASEDMIRNTGATHPYGYIFRPFNEKHILSTIETARIRHQFEKNLNENRKWLNAILTSVGDAVIACDDTGLVQFINPVAAKLTNTYGSSAVGKRIQDVLVLLDENTLIIREIQAIEEENEKYPDHAFEGLMLASGDDVIPIQLHLNPIRDEEKIKRGVVFAFSDITSQKSAINEIKRQADRAEALVKVAEQLKSTLDLEDVLNTVCTVTNWALNTPFTMVFLHDPKSNLYTDMARKIERELPFSNHGTVKITFDRETLMKYMPADQSVFSIPNIENYKDPRYRKFLRLLKIKSLAVAPLLSNRDVIGTLVSGSIGEERTFSQDDLELLKGLSHHVTVAISNAKLFEQIKLSREKQKKLAKGLLEVQEIERRHLARELHDDLGQALTGLQFMLETTKKDSSPALQKQMDNIQQSVGDVIAKVREMSLNLRPAILDDAGLIPALHWHFERYKNQTGILVNFQQNGSIERLPTDVEITAFRLIQEALTNTARHAQVNRVEVGVSLYDGILEIAIEDHGKGFDPNMINETRSTGLGGMRERAILIGGVFRVHSAPNAGTKICAELPVSERPIERRKHDRNHLNR